MSKNYQFLTVSIRFITRRLIKISISRLRLSLIRKNLSNSLNLLVLNSDLYHGVKTLQKRIIDLKEFAGQSPKLLAIITLTVKKVQTNHSSGSTTKYACFLISSIHLLGMMNSSYELLLSLSNLLFLLIYLN